jgi:hypothetical protein
MNHRTNTVPTPYQHRKNLPTKKLNFWIKMTLALFVSFTFSCTDADLKNADTTAELKTETRNELGNPIVYTCDPCLLAIETNVTEIIDINGCPVTVTYKVLECRNGQFQIRDFEYDFDFTDTDCTNLAQTWNQYLAVNDPINANLALNAFYKALTLKVQDLFMSTLNPLDYPSGYTDLQWIETNCHTLCAYPVRSEENEILFYNIDHAVCGEGCCIRNTTYIVVDGKWVKNNSSIVESDAFCDPVTLNCPEGGFQFGNKCEIACARLE